MLFLSLALCLLTGLLGVYLSFRAYKNFKRITQGDTSIRDLIIIPVTAGGATIFIFSTLLALMGLLDKTYVWTFNSIRGAILVSLIPAGIVSIGSFVQTLMIVGYRGILIESLKNNKKENKK